MPRTRVSSPFLRRMPPCVTLELGTCTKPGTRRRPVPQTRRRLCQSGRVQPQQPSTCTVCEVSRWLAGPHHLGESSREQRGTDTSAGQQSRARHGGTYTKIGSIQRRLAWPLRKDDTQIRERSIFWSRCSCPLLFRPSSREYTQRPRPFCASTPVPRTSVSSPFLRRMPPASLWNWARVQNLDRIAVVTVRVQNLALACPQTRRRLCQSGGSSPSSPAPARYARCRDGSPGPTTLVRARRTRGVQIPRRASGLVLRHGGTYTKIGSIQRRLAWPLRKDDTPNP
ncbi:hypothetical protein G5714_014690 [Onychostoma macrolepis]|uniref:Uncharacterized protein n=1 Tax=Onychostoma macrolepis TaxID=369639 RepID=A0A7J6CAK8_9TELE|nr:hypothetical protein G5714_014690 [Onychostoma macrolepis]